MLLFVPLALVPLEQAVEAQVIAAPPATDGVDRRLVEAFSVDAFVRAWIEVGLPSGGKISSDGPLRTGNTEALAGAGLVSGSVFTIRRGSAEQSNTSIRIGDGAILKVIRKLEEGIHPELEVGRFLTDEAGFAAAPALLGWAELRRIEGGSAVTLSVLQGFVPNEGDGWSWVLEQLAQSDGHARTVEWLRLLGRRTAEMHRAFATETADPAFRPEPVDSADREAWIAAAEAMARRALDGLTATRERLAPEVQQLADSLLARRGVLEAWLRSTLAEAPSFAKTRHHGDYHLGQVLVAGGDAVIVDFEGEPLRPLAERRAKHAALRDVAGMLRSLAYAAAEAGRADPAGRFADWEAEASRAYLKGYHEAAQGAAFLPPDRAATNAVTQFFMLEKALYEVAYELANRPDWVAIPLRGVLALLDAGEASPDGRPQAEGSALDQLAERMGIEPEFRDARGKLVQASIETKRSLLAAMGVEAADEDAARAALDRLEGAEWTRSLPPVVVLHAETEPLAIELVLPAGMGEFVWRLTLEEGGEVTGRVAFGNLMLVAERSVEGRPMERRRLVFEQDIPWGYHRLSLDPSGATTTLVVSPGRCWLPPAIAEGQRLWGIAAQLYLLRSATDWGIGDFGDLRSLVELSAARGAAVIGLNPLHAMFSDDPEHASPYSPASRLLLNTLNIDVLALPELLDCAEMRDLIASDAFRARLGACRASMLVDYAEVATIKLSVLKRLFEACRDVGDGPRWQAFDAFRRGCGAVLEQNCLFLALREDFASRGPALADWHAWPEEYRDPASPAVAAFAEANRTQIDFLAWLQWVADTQLSAAAAAAAERGMTIGLYRDLAVGADRAGAETWVNAAAVVSGAQVGAPPDIYNPAGQDWGLPPFHPHALREEGYRSFIDLVRANMRHAGGLRIDHVMGLQHLYWVPQGRKPADGAYVAYPIEDMVGILALESQRQRCLVVGEDLGTVPDGFRERMMEANILSYRVLFFEQEGETGAFLPPKAYPHSALAVVGSHDLPTLRGWWEGRDIGLKERLGLYPEPAEVGRQHEARQRDKAQLLAALRREALLPEGAEPDIPHLARAAHAFLARTPSVLAMAQIDDLTDEADPVNVPATSDEHPNWRRRLSMTLEELAARPRFIDVAEIFRLERGTPQPEGPMDHA